MRDVDGGAGGHGGREAPLAAPGLGMSVGRLEAFSDGVLAIVITLLILDIHVPDPGRNHGALGAALARQWPQYVAYLVSFLIVGIIWLNHHATINLLRRTDHTMQVLNLLLLLPVSVLPWPTALLADYTYEGTPGDRRLAVVVYGVTSTAMALTFNALWRYLLAHPELHKTQVTAGLLRVRDHRYNAGIAVYPLATLAGLFSVPLFLGIMLALALFYLLPTPDVRV